MKILAEGSIVDVMTGKDVMLSAGQKLTVGRAFLRALNDAPIPNKDGDTKEARWKIMKRLSKVEKGGAVEIDKEEAALLKKCALAVFRPAVFGPLSDLLEG
jgi:hypothetical protein